MAEENHDITAALRRHAPAALRVHLSDGGIRELAPPGGKRKRWSAVSQLLEEYQWSSCELLNNKSQVLHVLENDAPAEDLEDIGASNSNGQVAGLMNIMLRGQDIALRRNSEQTKQLVDAVLRLAQSQHESMVALQRLYTGNLKLVTELQEAAVKAKDDDDDDGILSGKAIAELIPLLAAQNRKAAP